MKIQVSDNEAVVSGYVNAVGRDSRLIPSARGAFVEQVQPGAFGRALCRAKNVNLLINHDKSRVLAKTEDGSLRLWEDNIGLYAEAVIKDADIVEQARRGEFRGWSFEFKMREQAWETTANGTARRVLKEIDMNEVSLIDGKKLPAYVGTTVEVRADDENPENGERRCFDNQTNEAYSPAADAGSTVDEQKQELAEPPAQEKDKVPQNKQRQEQLRRTVRLLKLRG